MMTMSSGERVGRKSCSVQADRRNQGGGTPMSMRRFGKKPVPAQRPAPQTSHIRFRPGFINKDKATWIKFGHLLDPLLSQEIYIRLVLLAGVKRFFYTGSPTDSTPAVRP